MPYLIPCITTVPWCALPCSVYYDRALVSHYCALPYAVYCDYALVHHHLYALHSAELPLAPDPASPFLQLTPGTGGGYLSMLHPCES